MTSAVYLSEPSHKHSMVASYPVTYVLEVPVSAVKLGEATENDQRGKRARSSGIFHIPAGSTVLVNGGCTISGMIDVVWEGQAYALFSVDLEERAKPSVNLRLSARAAS
jgi:hypothetical protein